MPPRFFLERSVDPNQVIVRLGPEESRHLAKVLRVKPGEEIALFVSDGRRFRAEALSVSPRQAEARIVEALPPPPAPRPITLAVPPIRPEPAKWLVQKATELGVARLAPFVSARTVAARDAEDGAWGARAERWRRISLAACKQCGRARPIDVAAARPFERLAGDLGRAGGALLAWEGGGAPPLARVLREGAADSLIVGPEGGFTAEEFQWALEQGVRPVDLGPNILRVETAALAGAAVILALAP